MDLNPELKVGDKVVIVYMEGEKLSHGTKGVVLSIMPDPIEKGKVLYEVKWESGDKLSIVPDIDYWTLDSESVNESLDKDASNWVIDNKDTFKYFNVKLIMDYLLLLRESGIVNMLQASSFLYLGKERIAHEFYYNEPENTEDFEKVLDMADEVQSELINGTLAVIDDNNLSPDEETVNRIIKRIAQKMILLYVKLHK